MENIHQADFIAIDGEFSGIIPINKLNYFDTPEERHQRHYNVRKKRRTDSMLISSRVSQCDRHYLMIQMGVATVRCLDQANNR